MADGFITRRRNSGNKYASIYVIYTSNATCTASCDGTILTDANTDGKCVFSIPFSGTWTVTISDGTKTKNKIVSITELGQVEKIELSFWNGELFSPGDQQEDLTGGWIASSSPYARYSGSDTGWYDVGGGKAPTLEYEEDGTMSITISGNYISGTVRTVNMVDLTAYSSLTLKKNSFTGAAWNFNSFYITQDVSSSFNYRTQAVNSATIEKGETATDSVIDISTITGSWYICISTSATSPDLGVSAGTSVCKINSVLLGK